MPDRPATGHAWEGEAYGPQAGHHRSVDEWFLSRHAPRPDDVVVDAGCGTGEFTLRLAELVPEGRVIGVEPDSSMLAAARDTARGDVEFRHGRLQDLDEICGVKTADLVISRAVFHWIPLAEYRRCYEAVFRVLKPGGWFHAESGGAGNVHRVAALMDDIAARHGLSPAAVSFPDAGTAMELLEEAGFQIPEEGVTTVAQRRRFDREAFAGFLRTQAAVAYTSEAGSAIREAFVADVEEHLGDLRRHDGSYDQTFVRLHVLCRRPG